MIAVCVLAGHVLHATIPTQQFDLVWQHSVQKTEWRETYRVTPGHLQLVAAYVQGSGAGMEPGLDARRTRDGWTWSPDAPPFPELTVASSTYTADYRICVRGRCTPLRELVGDAAPVTLRPCAS